MIIPEQHTKATATQLCSAPDWEVWRVNWRVCMRQCLPILHIWVYI